MTVFDKALHSAALRPFSEALSTRGDLLVEELWDAPKAILAALAVQRKSILIITSGVREGRLYDDLPFFTSAPVLEFPAWETLPSEAVPPSPDIVGDRYAVLSDLLEASGPSILLCPLQACLQRVLPPDRLKGMIRTIKVGDELLFTEFVSLLEAMGFERRVVAADKGEFAVRGGIIDLFPVDSPDPFRLEFFGDEIESIRRYDPVGQKSVGPADTVRLTPAKEAELLDGADHLGSILDYVPDALIVFDDLLAIEDRYVSLQALPGSVSRTFCSFDAFLKESQNHQRLYLPSSPIEELGAVKALSQEPVGYYSASLKPHPIAFEIFATRLEALRWRHPFEQLDLEHPKAEMVCVAPSKADAEHVKPLLPADTTFVPGSLSSGFALEEMAVVPASLLTGRHPIRRRKQRSTYHTPPSEFRELSEGELVVHYEQGIGRYLGVERRPDHTGKETEYLAVEYADTGKLYLPLTQSHLLSRYIGSHEEHPKLSKLGSSRWAKTRTATEVAIRDYAGQLLKMHANREVAGGFAYSSDGQDMVQFEGEFPYEETEDQLQAIAAIKADMETTQPMDRLVCGDVGYGKTEVAMRAAFKAVESGKQVAVLVPTTVLAMQHYDTFCERMASFPIRVGVLSRFQKTKETRATLEGLAQGSVDILIGTHRLVSADIVFKDLGLVIVDEEQRFGVRVKEKLRAFQAGVDCLTLTATPIPRTLYLSLMGARDLSVIQTPPQDRLPIKTIVAPIDDDRIKQALLRELARDGQAFYIHNRIDSIELAARRIRRLLPKARIAIAHGQMSADELDVVFHAFKQGTVDVLVATTIVENGIDIPNANTILIDRADRYGLAELYQLRGRVGRWSPRAYAYFLTPPNRALSEFSQARLQALVQVSGYGGGMKLAMRDLELRGAGNILGVEQSGHVSRIGFNLYCRLLKRTINGLQGKSLPSLTAVKLEFPQTAEIPIDYITATSLRMEIYQRFGEADSETELAALYEEIRDRFGPPPEPVVWLYHLMRIRIHAARHGVAALKLSRLSLTIEYRSQKRRSILVKPSLAPKQLEDRIVGALTAP